MVTAVVLIKAETDQVTGLAEKLAELDGVSEVFSVAGQYDLRRAGAGARERRPRARDQ